MIVVDAGRNPLPYVWSGWWWVFTAIRGPRSATPATSASRARLRFSVDVVSTSRASPDPSVTTPQLLTIQPPSGWTKREHPRCQLVEV